MSLDFSVCRAEDWNELREVQHWVYAGGPKPEEPELPEPGERGYLVRHDGRPVAGAKVYDFPTLVRGREMVMGGVGGVATLVEARRTGAAKTLMHGLLADLYQHAYPLTALYAYREPYYRRFGYELSGWRWEIKCPVNRLPKTECTLPVRRIAPEDAFAELNGAYTQFASGLSGSCLRNEEGWKDRLGRKPPVIYAVGEPVQGYFWGSFASFWEEASIGEFVWTTPESYSSLLSVIGGICSNKTGIVWNEPPLSPLIYTLRDQNIGTSMVRPTMWRIVNLRAAMQALKPSEQFTFELTDDLLTENAGVWLTTTDGVIEGSTPDFSLDIRALSQAYMGQPSLVELAQLGAVKVHNQGGFLAACRQFSPQNVVCMEFF